MSFFFLKNISYDLLITNLNNSYTDKIWLNFSNLISLFLIVIFVIVLGILLQNNAKHVQFLNLISAFYLSIYFFFNSLNFEYTFFNLNLSFNQNTTLFVNLFIFVATLTTIFFFLGISNVFFIQENSKIEFSFLIWFIYLSAIFLISSTDFISIIILLECIAFSSYVLVGFERKNKFSTTSSITYLILASIPSGFFILGVALLYHNFGSFSQDYLSLILNAFTNNTLFELSNNDNDNNFRYFWKDYHAILTNTFPKHIFSDTNLFLFFEQYLFLLNLLLDIATPKILIDLNAVSELIDTPINKPFVKDTYKDILSMFLESFSEERQEKLWKRVFEFEQERQRQQVFVTADHLTSVYISVVQELEFLFGFWDLLIIFYKLENTYSKDSLVELINVNKYYNITSWLLFFATEKASEFCLHAFDTLHDAIKTSEKNAMEEMQNFKKSLLASHLFEITGWVREWQISKITGSKFFYFEDPLQFSYSGLTLFSMGVDDLEDFRSMLMYIFSENLIARSIEESPKGYSWRTTLLWKQVDIFNYRFFTSNHTLKNLVAGLSNENLLIKPWIDYTQILERVKQELYYTDSFLSIYLVILFILMNLCFKLTAAPFHVWAPSVYGGSPLATLTFLSIFSKLTIIFFTIWLFLNTFDSLKDVWQPVLLIISFLSIICSILGAFSEKIFKRFFVYSSVGHVGFMLIGIFVLNIDGIKATVDYLILYILSSFLIWYILLHLSKKTRTLVNLKGLSFNQPMLSLIFSITIFSLSGIPPFGGFFVKYEIFYSILYSSFFYFAYILLLLTVISFFYYLRLIKIIFFEQNRIFIKNKNFNDIKLRLIAHSFFLIPFFMLYIENPIALFLKQILQNSLF